MLRAGAGCDPAVEYQTFYCPGCQDQHTISVKGPKAWSFNGNEEKPTFHPSILVYEQPPFGDWKGQPRCHSSVTDGVISFLPDSSHALAGQSVPLPPPPE